MFDLPQLDLKNKVSAQEWQLRVDLAACYRLVDHFRWGDLIYTHLSARLPGTDHYLVNAFGLTFDEVTASNLVKVDLNGNIIDDTPFSINPAGFTIHSAVHQARHDLVCVMHTHTVAGMAVAAQKVGLLPLAQTSLEFYENLAYHEYEGIAFDLGERARLVGDLGDKMAMILRNHGLLTCGKSVAQAFTKMHSLEKSCQLQIAAQAGGDLVLPSEAVCKHTAQQFRLSEDTESEGNLDKLAWTALLRKLDRINPGYDA